jgi:hypothetical protein
MALVGKSINNYPKFELQFLLLYQRIKSKKMKKLVLFGSIIFALSSCGSKSNEEKVNPEVDSTVIAAKFGADIEETGAITMDSLVAMINGGATTVENVKVEGKINAACQTKGCWMTVDKSDGSTMRVSFKDYGFFVPKDCAGKQAVMMGRAFVDTTSVEDLRHYAKDDGKSKEEIEKITEPEYALSFEADGVIIK